MPKKFAVDSLILSGVELSITGTNLYVGGNLVSGAGGSANISGSVVTGLQFNGGIGKTGLLGVSGAGNVSISPSGNTFFCSGNTGAYANFLGTSLTGQFGASGNLLNTGQSLYQYITSLSGVMTSQLTGLTVTGSNTVVPIINLTGIGGTRVILSGNNTIAISGGGGSAGESNTISNLGSGQGIFNQKIGVDLQFYNITGGTGINTRLISNDIFIDYNLTGSKSITIDTPVSGQKVMMFKTYSPIRVKRVQSVLITGFTSGQTRPSYVNYSLRFDPDVSAAGSVINSGFCYDTTTGDLFTSFTNSFVSGNCWVWYSGHSESGNVNQFNATMFYV